ncbi:hypothetical protein NM688_g249 [Phlebia brevispora]|uniref:Uncharacterized protein n=1 Tax=Phlebia brevispora TaxID=194682 RepID=A0ACC1TEI8_9APHY|nr:hypothetical protein NM688_g249 [Phlebia brevispora]
MASLHVYIMTATGTVRKEPFIFSHQGDNATTGDSPSPQQEFHSTELIYEDDTCVYRGVLTGCGSQEIKAICKLGLKAYPGSDVLEGYQHETEIYQTTLRDMQGSFIPKFYGMYVGTVFRWPAACIIVEDCGRSLPAFNSLSYEWRAKAVEVLMAIHSRGLQHNDFRPGNIVVDDLQSPTRLVLIDFEHATPHECQRKIDIALFQYPPPYMEFGCRELHRAARETCVWTPADVELFGTWVDVAYCGSPEQLLKVTPYNTSSYTYEQALNRAKNALYRYLTRWADRKDYVLAFCQTRFVLLRPKEYGNDSFRACGYYHRSGTQRQCRIIGLEDTRDSAPPRLRALHTQAHTTSKLHLAHEYLLAMASLELYMPNTTGIIRREPFALMLDADEAITVKPSLQKLEFRATETVHERDSYIYRGILKGFGPQDIKTVCKLGLEAYSESDVIESYRNEADAYQTELRDMQGRCVATFYGLYTGIVYGKPAVCIILEDCGVSIGGFGKVSYELCVKAIEILMAIHERGLQHNDFCGRNVVVDSLENPQRVVVIDFELATPHECRRKLDIALYQFPPDYDDFGCRELHQAATISRIWTPTAVHVFGGYVDVSCCRTAEQLLKAAPWGEDRYETREQALSVAKGAIRRYFDLWSGRRDYVFGDVYKALIPAM